MLKPAWICVGMFLCRSVSDCFGFVWYLWDCCTNTWSADRPPCLVSKSIPSLKMSPLLHLKHLSINQFLYIQVGGLETVMWRGSEDPESGGWIHKDFGNTGRIKARDLSYFLNVEHQAESGIQSIDNKHCWFFDEWMKDEKGTPEIIFLAFLSSSYPPHPTSNYSSALTAPAEEEAPLWIFSQTSCGQEGNGKIP